MGSRSQHILSVKVHINQQSNFLRPWLLLRRRLQLHGGHTVGIQGVQVDADVLQLVADVVVVVVVGGWHGRYERFPVSLKKVN